MLQVVAQALLVVAQVQQVQVAAVLLVVLVNILRSSHSLELTPGTLQAAAVAVTRLAALVVSAVAVAEWLRDKATHLQLVTVLQILAVAVAAAVITPLAVPAVPVSLLFATSSRIEVDMAHFAELDGDNIVVRVIVVDNSKLLDDDGVEQEYRGAAFCQYLFGGGRWVQSSYNANFRKNAAFRGCKYDEELDAFLVPQPYPSWTLDENCRWQPPVPYPDDGKSYGWSESTQQWIESVA